MKNLKDITKLREETGAGVIDCKKALEECSGDYSKAKDWLREKGAKVALKKADRKTNAGLVEAYTHMGGRVAALVKLSCETDFVARNKEFKNLAHELAMQVAAMKPKTVQALLKQQYIRDPNMTVKQLIEEKIGKLNENIKVEETCFLEI